MHDIYIQTLLGPIPEHPEPSELYDYLVDLGIIADRISADGYQAVAPLGHIVQLAALCAIASPVPDIPVPAIAADDVEAWLTTHGGLVDTCEEMHASATIAIGDIVPTLAGMLKLECPAELEARISAELG